MTRLVCWRKWGSMCMISRKKLRNNVDKTKSETKAALQLIWDNLNNGQQKKLVKSEEVYQLLKRYGIVE